MLHIGIKVQRTTLHSKNAGFGPEIWIHPHRGWTRATLQSSVLLSSPTWVLLTKQNNTKKKKRAVLHLAWQSQRETSWPVAHFSFHGARPVFQDLASSLVLFFTEILWMKSQTMLGWLPVWLCFFWLMAAIRKRLHGVWDWDSGIGCSSMCVLYTVQLCGGINLVVLLSRVIVHKINKMLSSRHCCGVISPSSDSRSKNRKSSTRFPL